MQRAKGRELWLDAARGAALLCMIFGHAVRDDMRMAAPALDLVYRCIYVFNMPLFFFLAGCADRRSSRQNLHALVPARARGLLAPWALYTAFLYAVFAAAWSVGLLRGALAAAGAAPVPPGEYAVSALLLDNPYATHLWFLPTLFSSACAARLALRPGRDGPAAASALCAVCIALYLAASQTLGPRAFFCVMYPLRCLPFFAFGRALDARRVPVPAALCGAAYVAVRAVWFSGFDGSSIAGPNLPVRAAVYALQFPALVPLLLGICAAARRLCAAAPRAAAGLARLGRASLAVYLLHQPFCCATLGVLLARTPLPIPARIALCFACSCAFPLAARRAWRRALAAGLLRREAAR